MTKYEKLEAEYNALETPEQQWAWVLIHKDEVKVYLDEETPTIGFKKAVSWDYVYLPEFRHTPGIIALLSVLGIEAEEV